MSFKRKRLTLQLETLRSLTPEELDQPQGGIVVPGTFFRCAPNPPSPFPLPGQEPPDDDPTPPDGIPLPFPRFPGQKAARKANRKPRHAPRSANGHCTGM